MLNVPKYPRYPVYHSLRDHSPHPSNAGSFLRRQRVFRAYFSILSLASMLVTLKPSSNSKIESTLQIAKIKRIKNICHQILKLINQCHFKIKKMSVSSRKVQGSMKAKIELHSCPSISYLQINNCLHYRRLKLYIKFKKIWVTHQIPSQQTF